MAVTWHGSYKNPVLANHVNSMNGPCTFQSLKKAELAQENNLKNHRRYEGKNGFSMKSMSMEILTEIEYPNFKMNCV